ncbi:MAG: hypothetical protein JNK04_10800 [Myxococcales bacterium]|nr:hypothetical protein [Myxococcales bacterium]
MAIAICLFLLACEREAPEPYKPPALENRSADLPRLASNAPADQVVSTDPRADAEYQRLVQKARAELPDIRKRFQGGLPQNHHLFITTVVRGTDSAEQLFVSVRDWSNAEVVDGLIASQPHTPGYAAGDVIKVALADVIDWTISRPDGSEEGNALGKYLESRP